MLPSLTNLCRLSLEGALLPSPLGCVFPHVTELALLEGRRRRPTEELLGCFPSLRVLQTTLSESEPLMPLLQLAQQRGVEEVFVNREFDARGLPWMEVHRLRSSL
jgi:hypothetical protein